MKEDRNEPEVSPMEAARDVWSKRRDIAERLRDDVPRLRERWRSVDSNARITVVAGVVLIASIIVLQFV